jgi:hypothetical protein
MSTNQENIEQQIQVEEHKGEMGNTQETPVEDKMLGNKREADYELERKGE